MKNPANLRIPIIFFIGLLYVFVIPLFQAPDEPAHFARSYGIAEGQLILKDHPRHLILFILHNFEKYRSKETNGIIDYLKPYEKMDSPARIPNIAYNTSLYSPVPYLFYAAVIRLLMPMSYSNGQMLISVYACRILSLILYCSILAISFQICPFFSWPVFWVAATPMAVSQASIVGTDSIVFCSSVLILALTIGPIPPKRKKRYVAGLILSYLFLILTKSPYIPLLILPALSLFFCEQSFDKDKARKIILALSISCCSMLLWNYFLLKFDIYQESLRFIHHFSELMIDPSLQLSELLKTPENLAILIWNTFDEKGFSLLHQMVGVFGWLEIPIPGWGVWEWVGLTFLPIIVTEKFDSNDISRNCLGIICFFITALTTIAIIVSAYLIWMPVGSTIVNLQGRYFHVVVVLLIVGLSLIRPDTIRLGTGLKRIGESIILLGIIELNSLSLIEIINHYGLKAVLGMG